MARKRKKLQGLDYQTTEYWNKLLTQEGLSMRRGESDHLVYQDPKVLERIEGERRTNTGRIKPKPQVD